MKREKELLKNTFILLFGTLLPKFASFITLPIYTKYLTKIEYGTYDLIFTIASLIVPLVLFQLQSAVFRCLLDENTLEEKKRVISTAQIFTFCMAIIFSIVLFTVFNSVDLYIRIIIISFMFLEIIMQMGLQIARGIGKNKIYSISSIINSFLNVFLVIPFLVNFKMGLLGLLLSLTISLLVSYLFLIFKTGLYKYISIKYWNKSTLKDMLKYSLPMIPNSVSWWIVNASDRFLITGFLGIEQNAIYAAASKIPSLYSLLYNTFNMAWQESASKSTNDNDVVNYYINTFNMLYRFLTGGMLILIACTPCLFYLLIDSSYFNSYYQIPILYLALYLLSFSNYLGGIYVAKKKTSRLAKSVIIGAIINIIINVLAINKFGLFAASISTFISYFVVLLYRIIDIKKYYKMKFDFKKMIYSLPLFVIVIMLYYNNAWYTTLVNIFVTFILFLILNKDIIIIIINRFRKKLIK